ncbi:MAG: hypothetical protein ACO3ND_10705 [Opitutales bacterium]
MSGGARGMVGSVLVHLLIAGAFVAFSWFAAGRGGAPTEPALVVDLAGDPRRRPGEVGKAPGVARGTPEASKGIKRINIPRLDMAAVARAQEAEARPSPSVSTKTVPTTSKGPKTQSKTGKTSLGQFLKEKGGRTGASGKSGLIGGVSVRGRPQGAGDNGGDGGGATAMQLYAGEVLARFRSAWVDIVNEDGMDIRDAGGCGVTVTVDASGNIRFGSWIRQPSDTRMAELVRRACARIGNCGPPPGGKGFGIDFPNISVSGG